MEFSVSEFKTNGIGKGGARSALFAVELQYPSSLDSPQSKFLIKTTSIPASTVGTYDVYYHGKPIKVAGDRTFDTWETTIINDEDFAIRKVLEKWIDLISDPKLNTRNTEFSGGSLEGENANYKKDIKVIQYNKDGSAGVTYNFRNAFPSALSSIALDWGSADIEEYTCTWTYDSWDCSTSSSSSYQSASAYSYADVTSVG